MFVATIGFFDGVHRGHTFLIDKVREEAEREGKGSMVLTMDCHPKTIVGGGYVPELLTTTEERLQLLRRTGVDHVEVLHFDAELAQMDAPTFMRRVLKERYGIETLLMGYDHRFGHGGGRNEDYVRWGEECGIRVLRAEQMEGEHVSSSEIRRMLHEGDVAGAAQLMGHPYVLTGVIEKGHRIGRTLGFPTANMRMDQNKLVPAKGVYAVETDLGHGIMNIGNRPTMNNGGNQTVEVHILDYCGDLYDTELQVWFVDRIRSEQNFPDVTLLKEQIQRDVDAALRCFAAPNESM